MESTDLERAAVAKPSPERWLVVPVVLLAAAGLLWLRQGVDGLWSAFLLSRESADHELKYQLLSVGLAALVLAVSYRLAPRSFRRYFRVGEIAAPVTPVPAIGLKPRRGEGWKQVGASLALVITGVTSVVIYFQVVHGRSIEPAGLLPLLPWVLLFAVVNSFVEEAIFRVSFVSTLDGVASRTVIYLLCSAVVTVQGFRRAETARHARNEPRRRRRQGTRARCDAADGVWRQW